MNKFLEEVGREVLGLYPEEMARLVEAGDNLGIWVDWSEADDEEIREWFAAVLAAAQVEKAAEDAKRETERRHATVNIFDEFDDPL